MTYCIIISKCQILTDNGGRLDARAAHLSALSEGRSWTNASHGRAPPTTDQSAWRNRGGVGGGRANRGTRRVGELRSGHGALYLSRPRTRRPRYVVVDLVSPANENQYFRRVTRKREHKRTVAIAVRCYSRARVSLWRRASSIFRRHDERGRRRATAPSSSSVSRAASRLVYVYGNLVLDTRTLRGGRKERTSSSGTPVAAGRHPAWYENFVRLCYIRGLWFDLSSSVSRSIIPRSPPLFPNLAVLSSVLVSLTSRRSEGESKQPRREDGRKRDIPFR